MVLGSYGSGVSIAGSPTYFADAGIPAIGVTCTNPQVTAGNSHYFRICFLDPFQGTVLGQLRFQGAGRDVPPTVWPSWATTTDVGLCHYFQQAFEAMGGMVISDTFPTGNSDFTSYLSNATAIGAEVFFCPVSIAYSSQIIRSGGGPGRELSHSWPATRWDNNVVAEAAKGTNVNVYHHHLLSGGRLPRV